MVEMHDEDQEQKTKTATEIREHTTIRLGVLAVFVIVMYIIFRTTGCAEVTQMPVPSKGY